MDPIKQNTTGQKRLGDKGFIAFIAYLSAFIPLSTDLYLPALPKMASQFQADPALVNLTLVCFFVFYAVGILFWGPLSDKYGRKRILITGLSLYILASGMCALAPSIGFLIFARALQAVGSGAVTATGTALVKDVYEGQKRVAVLAVVQSLVMVIPMVAPMIGALLLTFTSWRGVFLTLTIAGLLAVLGGLAMEETLKEKSTEGLLKTMGRLLVVAKNPGLLGLLMTFSLMGIPVMAYVSISSYIYQEDFGLNEGTFSLYFGIYAIFAVLGPLVYIRLSKYFHYRPIINICFGVIAVSGIFVMLLGSLSPTVFLLCIIPVSLANTMMRPPSANLMLEQQKTDTGAASSLINFTYTLFSSLGMTLISLNWHNRIVTLGALYSSCALLALLLWLFMYKSPRVKKPG